MPDFEPPDVIIEYKTSATFNENVICNYLEMIARNHNASDSQPIIFLDSAKCHKIAKVSNKLDEVRLQKVWIPPRLTNLLQPFDVCLFASLKKSSSRTMGQMEYRRRENPYHS